MEEFITPIVKVSGDARGLVGVLHFIQVSKGNTSQCFYSLPEFQEWKDATDKWALWKIKYYKGELNVE
jgi:hypothetical protein